MSAENMELRTRHPELLRYIEEARDAMQYKGTGQWTDDQLLASYALAVVREGYHHLGKIKGCGPKGVQTSLGCDAATWDGNLLTRIVLTAHRMGVRIEIGPSGPGMIKLMAHARYTNDDKNSALKFWERHPSLDHLASLCSEWKLPELAQGERGCGVSPEKQRIAIAEACGWKRIPKDNVGAAARLFYGDVWWRDAENNTIASVEQLPDYLNDLNAMHEAEKTLPQDLRARWMIELCKLTEDSFWSTTRATSAQRAEAFLRTLNLWTDEQ